MKTIYILVWSVFSLLSAGNSFSQSLSVNTDGSVADASALLDVKSNTKGLLIPRLTLAQRSAMVNPAISLMIYQTDNTPGYYYNAGTPVIPNWERLLPVSGSVWQLNGTHIYNTNSGNVGIGINTALARLHVLDSSVLFSSPGDVPGTPNIPIEGAGRRMLWYADKAAFRAGYVSGTQWNSINTGNYSVAMGMNTLASGQQSMAVGNGTSASGDYSFASGYFSFAGGIGAVAFGRENSANGHNSFVAGEDNTANGSYSIALGYANVATGPHSYVLGNTNDIVGINTGVLGSENIIFGNNSYAFGASNNLTQNTMAVGIDNTIISGGGSAAFGSFNTVGASAMAFGGGNSVATNSLVVGMNCTTSNGGLAAFGFGCSATTNMAFAIGRLAAATSDDALSIGISTQASGVSSFAIGNFAIATASNAISFGNSTVANGSNSTAIGQSASADGSNSLSIGSGNAMGVYSISIGTSNSNGDSSVAMGHDNIANGNHATAIGYGNRASAYAGAVLGLFNDNIDLPDGTIPVATDRLFQLGNGTNNVVRSNALTILRNGYAGFGTNNVLPLAPMHIKFNSGTIPQMILEETENDYSRLRYTNSGIANFWDITGISKTAGNNPTAELNFYYQGMPGNVLSLKGDGNATLAGTLTQLSDERFKKHIQPLQNSLQKLMQLNGYNYYWKDKNADNNLQTGVLAQELQAVFPELVKIDNGGNLSVNYSGLIPVLIESIKEQQSRILDLEKAVEQLLKNK